MWHMRVSTHLLKVTWLVYWSVSVSNMHPCTPHAPIKYRQSHSHMAAFTPDTSSPPASQGMWDLPFSLHGVCSHLFMGSTKQNTPHGAITWCIFIYTNMCVYTCWVLLGLHNSNLVSLLFIQLNITHTRIGITTPDYFDYHFDDVLYDLMR